MGAAVNNTVQGMVPSAKGVMFTPIDSMQGVGMVITVNTVTTNALDGGVFVPVWLMLLIPS